MCVKCMLYFTITLLCKLGEIYDSLKTLDTWPLAGLLHVLFWSQTKAVFALQHKSFFGLNSPFFPSPLPVAVTEVECVREGCQSEALRRLSGSVPENRCFTVVFRGARKSLDLLGSCEDEAQRWVRGLRTLKERIANMTQKEKLDQYPAHFSIC